MRKISWMILATLFFFVSCGLFYPPLYDTAIVEKGSQGGSGGGGGTGTIWKKVSVTTSLSGAVFTNFNCITAVGASGYLCSSIDGGYTWNNTQPTNFNYYAMQSIAWTGSYLIATSGGGIHVYDGTNWTLGTNGSYVSQCAFDGIHYVAVDISGNILACMTNPPVSGWTNPATAGTALYGICYDGGGSKFLAVGTTNGIYSCVDSIVMTSSAWNFSTVGSTNLYSVCYSAPLATLVAVGEGGAILYSTDHGALWYPAVSPTTNKLSRVIYNQTLGKFFAVGNSGAFISSQNGTNNWGQAMIDIPVTENLSDIACYGSKFVLIGWLGSAYVSP
jgi:photosystem II stability/assembly factor-like uncharacterized protein